MLKTALEVLSAQDSIQMVAKLLLTELPPSQKSNAGPTQSAEVIEAPLQQWGVEASTVRSGATISKRCVVTTAPAAGRLPG